jgi:hypothetical protein
VLIVVVSVTVSEEALNVWLIVVLIEPVICTVTGIFATASLPKFLSLSLICVFALLHVLVVGDTISRTVV